MPYNTLDPNKTGLLFFDMLNAYFRGANEAAQRRTEPIVDRCVQLRAVANEVGIPVYFAKADHRADGLDSAHTYTDTNMRVEPWKDPERDRSTPYRTASAGNWNSEIIDELKPSPGDYVVAKHRWNAFFQTHLELSLRTRGIDTIVLCGGATEIGIASTAYGARDLDFNLVFARDACNSSHPEVQHQYMASIFPRMGRVRTVDEIIAMMRTGATDA